MEERRAHFFGLIDRSAYEAMAASGTFSFSHKAMQAALLINLYQDEPILHQAYRLLQSLQDIDELLTQWRHRHALMVHRMLGVPTPLFAPSPPPLSSTCSRLRPLLRPPSRSERRPASTAGIKMGTGGSSGFAYLARTAAQHRIFKDLFQISTYLIPRSELPTLPASIRERLMFQAETRRNR